MRKPLFAALGLVSFVFVADVAFASDPKPLGAKITPEHLRKICAGQGIFTVATEGSGVCKFNWGETWNCVASGACVGWKEPTRPNTTTGAGTTAGSQKSASPQ
jgi:hypothetical protein